MEDKGAGAAVSMGVHPEKRVFHANENLTVSSVIPPHSLMAFGQFLKLPNYAEWLIRDRKQAQCLLRLVLGGGDEADFNIGNVNTTISVEFVYENRKNLAFAL